jgi:hypothetical protein
VKYQLGLPYKGSGFENLFNKSTGTAEKLYVQLSDYLFNPFTEKN